jgi:hypothetical protein
MKLATGWIICVGMARRDFLNLLQCAAILGEFCGLDPRSCDIDFHALWTDKLRRLTPGASIEENLMEKK